MASKFCRFCKSTYLEAIPKKKWMPHNLTRLSDSSSIYGWYITKVLDNETNSVLMYDQLFDEDRGFFE